MCPEEFRHVSAQYLQKDIIAPQSFHWIRFSCAYSRRILKRLRMFIHCNYKNGLFSKVSQTGTIILFKILLSKKNSKAVTLIGESCRAVF